MLEPGTVPFGSGLPNVIDGSNLWAECTTAGEACGVTYVRTTEATKGVTGNYLLSGDYCGTNA